MIKTGCFFPRTIWAPIRLLTVIALLLSGCSQGTDKSDSPADATALPSSHCSTLVGQSIAEARVVNTKVIEPGKPLLGFVSRLFLKWFAPGFSGIEAPQRFCQLTAKLPTSEESSVTVEAWLPDQWNGKILGVGGGGFNGGLGATAPLAMVTPLEKGYLAFVTDAGHEKTNSAKFAYDNREQLIDFAYRANQVAGTFAKTLASHYYEAEAEKAYFHGCSNGGRDALMLAQRSPQLYDGIIAGAPAADWSGLMTTFAWWRKMIFDEPGAPKLKKKLDLIHAAVLEQCDGIDGINDELISNPLRCDFDPSVLQCGDTAQRECLTSIEAEILAKLYRGLQLDDGTIVFPGLPPGGEGLENNWDLWVTKKSSPGISMSEETFRWMVFKDPEWSAEALEISEALRLAEKALSPVMHANNPDLNAFFDQDRKLLLYHGWNDAAIPATATVAYYEAVERTVGESKTRANARLFLVPGMQHCFGGVGPTSFDLLSAMESWDSTGVPPGQIIAKEYESPSLLPELNGGGTTVRTRPLCAWPDSAVYVGAGDPAFAENFECR